MPKISKKTAKIARKKNFQKSLKKKARNDEKFTKINKKKIGKNQQK